MFLPGIVKLFCTQNKVLFHYPFKAKMEYLRLMSQKLFPFGFVADLDFNLVCATLICCSYDLMGVTAFEMSFKVQFQF